MKQYPTLWQCYLDDFLLYKLRLGDLHRGAISQQVLCVLFQQLQKQDAISRVVSLHCYTHIHHDRLANLIANLLPPLNKIQQVGRFSSIEDVCLCACMHALHKRATFPVLQTTTIGSHLLAPTDPEGEALAKVTQTQNLLGTPEHIATLVVDTLFAAIVEVSNASVATLPEKMRVWFMAYRYMRYYLVLTYTYTLPYALPQRMYASLPPPPPPMHTQKFDDFISSEEECL